VWCGRRKRELGNERRCEDGTVRWCCVESWVVLLCVGALDVDVAPMGTGGGWQEVAAVALSRASCQARWRWRWRWRWRRRASWSYDAIDPRSAAVEAVEGLAGGQGQQRAVQYEGGSGVRVSRWCLQTGGVCVVDDSSSQQRRRRRKTDGGDLRDGNGRREREQRQQQRGS
jgi:hypothetical protein